MIYLHEILGVPLEVWLDPDACVWLKAPRREGEEPEVGWVHLDVDAGADDVSE